MLTWITLPSPAKLNLFLHIVGRRPDGYHELQTLFQFLDYGDELTFTLTPEQPGIRLAEPVSGVPDNDNLVIRAAKGLAATTENTLPGVTIHIHKRLPMGGGLGGGSTNAATTLLAMNRLWELNLGEDQLAEIGLGLGAATLFVVWTAPETPSPLRRGSEAPAFELPSLDGDATC